MYPVEAAYSQWLHVATPCETWSMLALPRSLHQQVQHLASGYTWLLLVRIKLILKASHFFNG